MPTQQPPPPSPAPGATSATRTSARIKLLAPVIYNAPRTPKEYVLRDVYDRDPDDPEWYWVKWQGYKSANSDTPQHRSNLERDGFGELCEYVDRFKDWQDAEKAKGKDVESLTFQAYRKVEKIPREFAADDAELCYAASLRTASDLLGIVDYLPDVFLDRFFVTRPKVKSAGLTWQDLTKLMQLCNSGQKKQGGLGLSFGGKRSKTNLVRRTISGPFNIGELEMQPGVYLCGVATATAGHMFVLRVKADRGITVFDSLEARPKPFNIKNFPWVTRWLFIRQCFVGHF